MKATVRTLALGVFGLAACVLVGCGSSLDQNATNSYGGGGGGSTGTITGTIYGSYNLPVDGSNLPVTSTKPVSIGGLSSIGSNIDANGHYTLSNVPVGLVLVVVTINGYTFSPVTVSVTANNTTTADILGTTNDVPPTFVLPGVAIVDANGNDATASPNKINGILGATLTITASASSSIGRTVSISANYSGTPNNVQVGGPISNTSGVAGTFRGTVVLGPNVTTAGETYTFTVIASDGIGQTLAQKTVTVPGLDTPSGVGGSGSGSGGGPPIPSIRGRAR